MKTIIKELNLLDIEDIENAVSSRIERQVTIAEIECSLVYCIPCDSGKASGMYLELTVDDEQLYSFDLFYDDDNGHYLDGKKLSLDEPWLPASEVFNFDTSVFKSFDSWADSSD